MASYISDSCKGNSVVLENYFAVPFGEQRLGSLLTCRMRMSFPKVRGSRGIPACSGKVQLVLGVRWGKVCLPVALTAFATKPVFPHICPPARLAFSWAIHFWSQKNQEKGRKEEKTPNPRATLENTLIATTITPAICECKGKGLGCENSSREELILEFENPSLLRRTRFQLHQKI